MLPLPLLGCLRYFASLRYIPQLTKFRFRSEISCHDFGLYGFGPSQSYISFDEVSPIVEISPAGAQWEPRYTFLAPRGDSVAHPGPMILDVRGELVRMKYNWGTAQDFRVQRFKGQGYLTYWQGDEEDGHGCGSWYMVGSQKWVRMEIYWQLIGDSHCSWTQHTLPSTLFPPLAPWMAISMTFITVNDTALITIYDSVSGHDASSLANSRSCKALDFV